nr:MAG TPA: hypothetical protein [Caudoviricetes sp.]
MSILLHIFFRKILIDKKMIFYIKKAKNYYFI